MASRAEKRLWQAVWLTVFASSALACDREEDVVVETLDLAEGEYSGLTWGGTQVERFHVLARRGPRNEPGAEVVLWSPQHEKPCSLGPTPGYRTLQPRTGAKFVLGSPSPARVGFFENVDEHGVGTLSFADINCERTGLEVSDVHLRALYQLASGDLLKLRLGLIGAAGTWTLVNPWEDEALLTEASDVVGAWTSDEGAWLDEGGQLVKRDLDGREVARRRTTRVEQLMQLGGEGDLAYIDEGRAIIERLGKAKEVATDACDLRRVDSFVPGGIAFYAPCDSRRLVISRATGELLRYEPVSGFTAQRGQLILVRTDERATEITTVFANQPEMERRWFELPPVGVEDIWPVAGSWLARVRAPEQPAALLRVEDRVPAPPPTTVADGITSWSQHPRGIAWVRDEGELTVMDRDARGIYLQASGVISSRWIFDRRATAIAYVSERDPDTGLGRLRIKLLSGETFSIARDVRQYLDVWWPERGILYAQGGDKPGIRFGRVDLPCEMTSDSPWACGF